MTTPISGYVYLIGSERFGWYKIGKSRQPKPRCLDIGVLLPFQIEMFAIWKCRDYSWSEQEAHRRLAQFHINGEWFCLDCGTRNLLMNTDLYVVGERIWKWGENSRDFEHTLWIFNDKTRDGLAESKKIKGLAFSSALSAWLEERELPKTKENMKLARQHAKSLGLDSMC